MDLSVSEEAEYEVLWEELSRMMHIEHEILLLTHEPHRAGLEWLRESVRLSREAQAAPNQRKGAH